MEMRGFASILAMSSLVAGATCFAQSAPTPTPPTSTPPTSIPPRTAASPVRPAVAGEPWTAFALYEFINPGETQPQRRERTQQLVCVVPGKFGSSRIAGTNLPNEYREKCWVESQRTENHRRQVKYACNDGMTAEAVLRRESDGSFGSKFVVNQPGKGGIAVTRTFRKAFGVCDLSKVSPEVPMKDFDEVPPGAPPIEK